ncbi:Rho GTPase-activating protein 12 [Heterocephalus glaber]|uniref:Rho GTPase-activating protein 12 n=1 Tax=Heterocephalus glaber TaxID=10181 RepID=G5BSK1_HETGA|nr:Rho GTPase-activating protein 12 [Heterocephalus glaber]
MPQHKPSTMSHSDAAKFRTEQNASTEAVLTLSHKTDKREIQSAGLTVICNALPYPRDSLKEHTRRLKEVVFPFISKQSCTAVPEITHQDPGQEKYGLLIVTKITENGKKVQKSWLSSWAVLQGSSLLFTKTQGTSTSWFGSNQSKPEFTVDLKGAVIKMASKGKSSKKNIFELKTHQGKELLIQSDNDAVINDWFKVLSSAINNQAVETVEAIEEEIPGSPGIEKQDKEKDQKDLKKLHSMKAVREKGYIKDQVFGVNLANLCQRENGTVPGFVRLCIKHVKEWGLDVDRIYTVRGNFTMIQKLRFAINHDEKLDLNDSKWEDIHVISGALKMFF